MATHLRAGAQAERRFYIGMAIAMILIAVIGFGPSFYLRDIMHSPRPNPTLTPLVLLHGVMFSIWMLLFLAQAALISANRRDLHKTLGIASMIFAILLVPLMYVSSVGQIARANQPPFTDPLNWSAVPLFIIPAFIALVHQGWKHRHSAQAHKRLMLGAALLMMDPAIGRLPIVPPVLPGFAVLNLLSLAMFLPLMWWDKKSLGKVHWATKVGAGAFAIALGARLWALATGFWAPIVVHFPGVAG